MIEIMNLRNTKPSEPYDVKVDRTSPLGNLFTMRKWSSLYNSKDEERNKVCDEYEKYFEEKIYKGDHSIYYEEILRLKKLYDKYGKLRLFCWCAPKRCHSETIRDYILERV